MSDGRPDPDELLERVRAAEEQETRGRLTVFFGAAPGVGKTYTMLEAARAELGEKRDVVVGVVETHGRYDTEALVLGFELIPRRTIEHQKITLSEFDLDAALARHPDLILVDEMAHTNAPGSRHLKRWQDVEELLDAGIDVFTSLNVQHLESLNDVVAQITGVIVRETVPDSVLDKAYSVRLVDLPVDELIGRLHEGKVYVPQQAQHALKNFFKEGNLIALRELALRRTAERVDAQMRSYKAAHGIEQTWHAGERVLVCVSPSPYSAQLVRAAKRMAASLHSEFLGVYVETPAALRMSAGDRDRLAANMRLVEHLGGDAVTIRGADAAVETVRYARKRNVTKIVLGKPTHARWRDVIKRSFLDEVVRQSREIDVYVISGFEGAGSIPAPVPRTKGEAAGDKAQSPRVMSGYLMSVAMVALVTVVARLMAGTAGELADVIMMYLAGILLVAMRSSYGPSLLATVLSVIAVDLAFVPPFGSFAVSDFRHAITFVVMFVVAVVISYLTQRIRDQADSARAREARTGSLYALSRELGVAQALDSVLDAAARHLREVFALKVAFALPDHRGELAVALADDDTLDAGDKDLGVAAWVWAHQRPAGLGTDTLPSARGTFMPLRGSRGKVGILALFPSEASRLHDPDERQLLETFSGLIGSAVERLQLADATRVAQLRMEAEQLRNALLSSVSHDLRTPLGVVTGATSTLLEQGGSLDEGTRRDLLQTAHEESLRLSRLVRNLLDMTRLQAGALKVQKDLQPLEEVVGTALNRLEDRLRGRPVTTELPEDLPLVPIDSVLIDQVLVNLLENAIKYTPAGSALDISARARDREVEVEVADRGPGVPRAYAESVFDKFYRMREREGGGAGLGLAICRGIVQAHGGRIWVEERAGGGASFRFTLPLAPEDFPSVPLAPMADNEERPS
jgi:two-component system sensor histidine kinase KdpD